MYIRVIDDFSGLDELRDDWAAVYAADPEAQFFLSWRWIADWLSCHTTPWFVLAAKRDEADAEYAAFLPMRLRTGFDSKHGFHNQLYFAGDGFSDYTGILTRPEFEAQVVPAFADYVKREFHWTRFRMDNLLMSEQRRRLFLAAFDKVRFDHDDIEYVDKRDGVDNGLCLSIDLPGDWDGYLATLSANNRQKIRRLLRKVDAGDDCRISLADGEAYEPALKMLLDFWRTKWAARKGPRTDEIILRNYAMLKRCAANGTLLLPVFWHGERPVAALGILVDECKRSLLFFITGRDETYGDMPAGYLLQAFSIRYAIAHGFTAYHFLKGDEAYKYLFAPAERRLRAVAVFTKNGRNLGGKLDPRGRPAMLQIALEFERDGETADAERAYRQILDLAPDDDLALYRFGRFLAKKGDHAGAKRWLTRSVELAPGGDNAWLWLARSLHSLGDDAAARKACYEVLKRRPDDDAARALMLQLGAPGSLARGPTGWPAKASQDAGGPSLSPPYEAMIGPLQQLAARSGKQSLGTKSKL